ncbi:PAS domain-containing hybrid sensor histidine kinase/response regulator [Massilia endophytica]|uniref:PAS domain-containing hybrid sensor histidine kinase/response regulator n=1 Tax=Massilia endophytica TaxID=2899220 RepID=UPI001E4D02BB|nr:PAS domain-containing protein [Massilia endophytica]UGQ45830.1 PAS domain-containing protein [Massilia endophytica]
MNSSNRSHTLRPDFELLFESTPVPYLLLRPDLTILAVNEAYLQATKATREMLLDRGLFEAFPDNPAAPAATGVRNLSASLSRVLRNKAPDKMPVQKYDIPVRGSESGEFEERYWDPVNTPVLDRAGDVVCILHSVVEVTEQVRKQQAVESSEAHFRQIADAIPQIVWSTLPDGFHDYFNKQWYEFVGRSADSAMGDEWTKVFHPDDIEGAWKRWQHSLATGAPYEAEFRLCHRSGKYRWVLGRALPVRNEAGEIVRWMGTSTDIHDWKQTQEELRDAQYRLEAALTAAEIGTWNWDLKQDRIYADRNFARLFQVSEEEAHGGPVSAYLRQVHPDDVASVEAEIAKALETGSPFQHVHRLRNARGEIRYIHARAKVHHDRQGSPTWMPGVVIDITDQKLAEEAMKESEATFRTLAENIPQLAWMADSGGFIFWYNNRWFAYTGTTLEQMKGYGWEKVHHPDHVQRVVAKYREAIVEKQVVWEDTFPLRGADGSYRWFLSRAMPIRGADGKVVRWLGTNTDITAQREAEEALEHANRRKDDFLAMLAHELRNPLAPISTAAQLLKLPGQNENMVRRSSDIISRQVKHLTELVDDLLDVSRVTRGLVSIDRNEVDVKAVLNSAIEQSMPLIESRRHVLTTRLASSHPLVLGDRTRLVQVVTNLLNNSAKYTPQGGEIRLAMDVDDGHVRISVSDNGIGIDAALLPHVFELFTQAERTPDRSQGGLGLGLALVRSIAGLHGGEVTAKSDGPGKGSTFELTLPVLSKAGSVEETETADGHGHGAASPLQILLVDDNADAAQSLATLLRSQGHHVAVEADARGALEHAPEMHPDVFILDIGLPDLDGYELSRQFHARPEHKDAMYIAVSGYGQAQDKVLAKAAGFDQYFVKPVDVASLQKALQPGNRM